MKKVFKGFLVILLVAALGSGGLFFYQMTTPKLELGLTYLDVKKSGIDGLKKHLTEEANSEVEWVMKQMENPLVSGLLSKVTESDKLEELKNELSEIQWEVKDILTGKENAEVKLGFNYQDEVIGTITMTMKREGYRWQISGVEMPSFDKFFF